MCVESNDKIQSAKKEFDGLSIDDIDKAFIVSVTEDIKNSRSFCAVKTLADLTVLRTHRNYFCYYWIVLLNMS